MAARASSHFVIRFNVPSSPKQNGGLVTRPVEGPDVRLTDSTSSDGDVSSVLDPAVDPDRVFEALEVPTASNERGLGRSPHTLGYFTPNISIPLRTDCPPEPIPSSMPSLKSASLSSEASGPVSGREVDGAGSGPLPDSASLSIESAKSPVDSTQAAAPQLMFARSSFLSGPTLETSQSAIFSSEQPAISRSALEKKRSDFITLLQLLRSLGFVADDSELPQALPSLFDGESAHLNEVLRVFKNTDYTFDKWQETQKWVGASDLPGDCVLTV
ncbi:hypothetical protein SISNIDRAFT_483833 [Sistotremastrum niveocremeum HHB9708]|uniref:Uncharacterized protein n=1 Tax=Sistotremastrum niveocremeum HHB9708 TaxID=1314777 RepID=A0A164X3S7_9AGAM|nr:hypothetical protein SISNIDRAFT_483833 [Sistotremastrum niveocremeum HHB9708]